MLIAKIIHEYSPRKFLISFKMHNSSSNTNCCLLKMHLKRIKAEDLGTHNIFLPFFLRDVELYSIFPGTNQPCTWITHMRSCNCLPIMGFYDALIDEEVLHVDHSYEAAQLHLYHLLGLPLWAFIDAIIDDEFHGLVGSDIRCVHRLHSKIISYFKQHNKPYLYYLPYFLLGDGNVRLHSILFYQK